MTQMTQVDWDELETALTDGKIKQVRRALHKKDEGMCCLGVMCHLQAPKLKMIVRKPWKDPEKKMTYNGMTGSLPTAMQNHFVCGPSGPIAKISDMTDEEISTLWEGRTREALQMIYPEGFMYAMTLNDLGMPFPRLAELLKPNIVIINNYIDRSPV
jgi:hypothetical protein